MDKKESRTDAAGIELPLSDITKVGVTRTHLVVPVVNIQIVSIDIYLLVYRSRELNRFYVLGWVNIFIGALWPKTLQERVEESHSATFQALLLD